ncbi:hypothetical protein BOX15_Mlig005304g1 [Macrostomum lignano]|uniref:Uncharacterized protein n=1 Tax=Macrostomum lignano TaxID=282301 RepID=A0A267GD97_9PLAT|nr:hypothetical protein BOX15_Mlig005304g1 [Macrostomum lignano]
MEHDANNNNAIQEASTIEASDIESISIFDIEIDLNLQRLQSGIQDHHSLIQSLGNDFERLELSDEPVYDDSDELQAQLDEQLSNISRHIRRRRDETVQAVDSGVSKSYAEVLLST